MFCCRFLSHCIQILRDINTKSEISVDHRSQYRIMLQRSRRRRSEEHTSELQSHSDLVCRLLLEKKKTNHRDPTTKRHRTTSTDRNQKKPRVHKKDITNDENYTKIQTTKQSLTLKRKHER